MMKNKDYSEYFDKLKTLQNDRDEINMINNHIYKERGVFTTPQNRIPKKFQKTNEKPLKAVLNLWMQATANANPSSKKHYEEAIVFEAWNSVMGKVIEGKTKKKVFIRRKLIIFLDSPSLSNELNFYKLKILQRLNEHLETDLVMDIEIKCQ